MAERQRQTAQVERRRRFVRKLCPLLFWSACPSGNLHYVWESKCYCAGGDGPPLRWIAGSWHVGYRVLMFEVPPQDGTTSVPQPDEEEDDGGN